jgi:hypothetical protein
MDEQSLPNEIRDRASVSPGGEHAWRMADVLEVVAAAQSVGLAVLGGQAQFQFVDGVCEPYWLEYGWQERTPGEDWDSFVRRSADEVLAAFELLCSKTDFRKVALDWEFIRNKIENGGIEPMDHLWFVLYFKANDAR